MSTDRGCLDRFREGDLPRQEAQTCLEAGRLAARRGNLDEARYLIRAAVQIDPDCSEAWLQLAWLTEVPRERKALLQQVLTLEPDHMQARAELARLQASPAPLPATGRNPEQQAGRWALVLSVLVAGLSLLALLLWGPVDRSLAGLLPTPTPTLAPTPTRTPAEVAAQFEPKLQAAMSGENWERAVDIAAIMLGIDPSGEVVHRRALEAHLGYGQALVEAGQVSEALRHFDQAVTLVPGDAEAQRWQEIGQMYLTGREALLLGDWSSAIDLLTQAYERMPDFGDLSERVVEAYRRHGQAALEAGDWTVAIESLAKAQERLPGDPALANLLSTAYRKRGIASQEESQLQQARSDLEAALALRPDDTEAQAHYDEVMYILFPPKRIEIDISAQRFYAFEGDTLIWNFPTSTGVPGRDTATGRFKVLDKIPMAYSSIWRLKMPYWLGIYYVGPIENGIHALPIRPDGTVMWAGLLGQKASYGCVILSTEAARLVYDWAEIGTAVEIHY